MSGARCLICGATVPEDRQVCPRCAEIFEPCAEIMAAALNKSPVEYDGIKYGCISAFTVRFRSSRIYTLNYVLNVDYVLQVELMSGKQNSIVIANPKDVKILTEYKKEGGQ